ncbi:MAG TPA: hypothetical protein VHW43_02635, partial [Puia sp.]|nr:hypothetical protein [Puia sp.]
MNSRLEQFVRDHREEFDGEEPDNKIWEKIRNEVTPSKKKQGILVRLGRAGWAAAAAVVLVAVGSVWYFSSRTTAVAPGIVQTPATNPGTSPDTTPATASAGETKPAATGSNTPDSPRAIKDQPTLASIRPKDNKETPARTETLENTMDEEMYHYAKLV